MVTDLVGNQSHAQEANRAVYYYSQVNENRFGYIKRCYEKEKKTKQNKERKVKGFCFNFLALPIRST